MAPQCPRFDLSIPVVKKFNRLVIKVLTSISLSRRVFILTIPRYLIEVNLWAYAWAALLALSCSAILVSMPSLSRHGKETIDAIIEELEDHEISNYEQKPFVTPDSLKSILPEPRVALIVGAMADSQEIEIWQQPELIRMIADNGLRVFATLLLISRPGLIQNFKETDHFAHSQLDSRLPLSIDSLNQIFQDVKVSARFYKRQWRFLAPFFRADQSHRELQENVVLPFTKCVPLGEGGFGNIDMITMAASYQGLVSTRTGEVKLPASPFSLTDLSACERSQSFESRLSLGAMPRMTIGKKSISSRFCAV